MKFDEISTKSKSKFKKYGSTIISIFVFVVVLVLFFTLYSYLFKETVPKNTDEATDLKKDDLLVRELYSKVHDFNEKDSFWIYKNETGRLVSNMTEATKMSLVYINLKISDFSEIDCDKVPSSILGYESYTCSDKTKVVKLDRIERVYKELFGKKGKVNTSSTIRIDPYDSGVYVYLKEIDAYVLYSREVNIIDNDSNYSYEIIDVNNSNDEIRIYEEVTNNSLEVNNKSKYVYTFKLESDGIYTYYSRESN